jgi:MFS transporter, OFA family, oxalate/formate antiporter
MATSRITISVPGTNRWVVLGASILINFCNGIGYTWSVFINPLGALHNWSPSELAFAFTLSMGFVAPVTMIASAFLQKIRGPKFMIILGSILAAGGIFASSYAQSIAFLYLTYGILFGFGFNVTNSLIMGSIVKFFPDRKGLALGCVLTGLASGAALLAPLAAWLIGKPTLGATGTFRIFGSGFLVLTILGSIMFKNPPDIQAVAAAAAQETAAKEDTPKVHSAERTWQSTILQDKRFYLIALLFVAAAYAGITLISSASPIGQSMFGLSPQSASFAISIIAVSNALGRLAGGALNDRIGGANSLRIIYGTSVIMLLAMTLVHSPLLFILAMTGIGFCYGICMVTFPSMISMIYGSRHFVLNYGITFLAFALTSYLAPKVSAIIRTSQNGDYTLAFYIAAAVCLAGIGLSILLRQRPMKETR